MPDPKKVPLGDGLADNAKRELLGRRKRLEDALDDALDGGKRRDNDVRQETQKGTNEHSN